MDISMLIIALCIGIPLALGLDLLVRRTKAGFFSQQEEAMFLIGIIIVVVILTGIGGPIILERLFGKSI